MPLYIDEKYAKILGGQLTLFKWSNNTGNFRCPICGDSAKQKTKKRGYFYQSKDKTHLNMKCHNCQVGMSFAAFLKSQNPALHKDYVYEAFKYDNEHRWYAKRADEREDRVVEILEAEKDKTPRELKLLTSVADLPDNHDCKIYVRKRKIPFKFWKDLYFTENYQKWIHDTVDSTKFKYHPKDDWRLVIPFRSAKGKVFAYQGRYIGADSKALRYITITKTEDMLIYGLDRIDYEDYTKRKYAFEGPIDSMYIPNSLAAAGSALIKLLSMNLNVIFVFDNEPRNKEIIKLMQKVIETGNAICIWPERIREKDVGQMVENGQTPKEVLDIIDNNVYACLEAELKFNEWRKL